MGKMNTRSRFHGVWRMVLWCGGACVFGFGVAGAAAAGPGVVARQVIIRAPEMRVVEAVLAHPEDEALAKVLRGWVEDGTATVVSDVSTLITDVVQPVRATAGKM